MATVHVGANADPHPSITGLLHLTVGLFHASLVLAAALEEHVHTGSEGTISSCRVPSDRASDVPVRDASACTPEPFWRSGAAAAALLTDLRAARRDLYAAARA